MTQYEQGRREELLQTFLQVNRQLMWAVLLVATPLVIFARELIVIYLDESFLPAAGIAIVVYVAYAFRYSTVALYPLMLASGQIKTYTMLALAMQIASAAVGLGWVYFTDYGAMAAVLCFLLVTIIGQVCIFWPFTVKFLQIDSGVFLWRSVIPGLVPFVLIVLIANFTLPDLEGFLATAVGVVGLGVVYAAVLGAIIFKWFPEEEGVYITSALGRLMNRVRMQIRSHTKNAS